MNDPLKNKKTIIGRRTATGQKKHCIKVELQINADNEKITTYIIEKGSPHDITIFKKHQIEIEENIEILADSGYQGLQKIHAKCKIPFKKTKLKKLTEEQKTYNKNLSQERIKIEHINRRCKNFGTVRRCDCKRYLSREKKTLPNYLRSYLWNYKFNKSQT